MLAGTSFPIQQLVGGGCAAPPGAASRDPHHQASGLTAGQSTTRDDTDGALRLAGIPGGERDADASARELATHQVFAYSYWSGGDDWRFVGPESEASREAVRK